MLKIFSFRQRHLFSGLIRAGAKLKELDLSHNALGPVGVEGMVEFMSSPVCYSLEVSCSLRIKERAVLIILFE